MTIDDKIKNEKIPHAVLISKQQKYRYYHAVKLIKMNILQAKEYYDMIKVE